MHLQGNLQTVFDALYHMGVIDPVLKLDWCEARKAYAPFHEELRHAVKVANRYQSDLRSLIFELEKFESQTLEYLAMEVAREFAEMHARNAVH